MTKHKKDKPEIYNLRFIYFYMIISFFYYGMI